MPVSGAGEDPVDGGDELTAEVEQEVDRVVASLPTNPPVASMLSIV